MSATSDVPPIDPNPLAQASLDWPSVALDADALADLELLLLGGFGTPLRYADADTADTAGLDADTVLPELSADVSAKLSVDPRAIGPDSTDNFADNLPAPSILDRQAPTLHVEPAAAEGLVPGMAVALRDLEGVMVAALRLTSMTRPTPTAGTARTRLGGTVEAVRLPHHPDYPALWRRPDDVRADLARRLPSEDDRAMAVAVWADALLHTADLERIARLRAAGRFVVVLAAAGGADPADRLHHVRVRCLRAALGPLGPLGVPGGPSSPGDPAAVPLVLVPLRAALLTPATAERTAALYGLPTSVVEPAALGAPDAAALDALHDDGTPLPAGLTPAVVAGELARAYPPRHQRGLAVLFTGLSGSGKSTLASLLTVRLLERSDRRDVTLLDGDVVRTHLSKGLGFSKADRDTNVRRIGFVAAQAAGAGGTVVCAPIAPFAAVRAEVRAMVTARRAGFVLVHVSTPVEVCEARDRKGLYAKARAGIIPAFTGVSDPYEVPHDAEVVVDASVLSPDEAVAAVLDHLRLAGWLG